MHPSDGCPSDSPADVFVPDLDVIDAELVDDHSVDWTQLLPELCRVHIVQCMDTISRSAWRVVNKQACQDVHAATQQLTWQTESKLHGVPLPLTSILNRRANRLPSELLSKLPNLRHLLCNFMHDLISIEGVPSTLRSLDLTNCFNMQGFSALQNCSLLEQLTLSGIYVRPEGLAETLPGALSTSLRRLTINLPNCLSAGYVERKVLHALAPVTRLQQLLLGVSALLKDWQAFVPTLSQMTDLRLLELSFTRNNSPLVALAPAIGHLRQLHSLQITGCGLSVNDDDAAALAQAMTCLPHQLTRFSLTWACMSAAGTSHLASAIKSQSGALVSLHLGNNNSEADGIMALAPALKHCTCLTDLRLAGNSLGTRGARALGEALAAIAPSLTALDLPDNTLGRKAAKVLAPAIGTMTALQHLGVGLNQIAAEGLQALVLALQPLPIQELDIGGNSNLGLEGAQILAAALHTIPSLHHVELFPQDVGIEGAALLKAEAEKVPGLTVGYL